MNSRAKGRRNELKARDVLLADGWLVETVKGSTMYQEQVDLFGLWDLIAVKKGRIRWIQVKTNRLPPPKERDAMSCFPGPGSKELWIFYDRKKLPRIIKL